MCIQKQKCLAITNHLFHLDCLTSILNDMADLQYSYAIFSGDMNIDLVVKNELCSVLQNFSQDLV